MTPTPDSRWRSHCPNYAIQRGHFGDFDIGILFLETFLTDFKRNFYVVRQSETTLPKSIQHANDRTIAVREIVRQKIKVGRSAGETLEAIVSAVEKASYLYTPFINIGIEDYETIQRALANSNKSRISPNLHNEGNNRGLVSLGPDISPFRTDLVHSTIHENHLFALEY